MKAAGLIAEFNPFHAGHARLIAQMRASGADCVVAVMSGNFVQRGEPAMFSDRRRAETALRCGVDLVLQLPVPYALAGAQRFARASVTMLASLGCAESLWFGSECGDLALLQRAAEITAQAAMQPALRAGLDRGLSFAAAREAAVRSIDPAAADVLQSPNNNLAVEYLHALAETGGTMTPHTVRRTGAAHDAPVPAEGEASASAIRALLAAGQDWQSYLPAEAAAVLSAAIAAGEAPVLPGAFDGIALAALRLAPDLAAQAPDRSEGVEHRLAAGAQSATSIDALLTAAKTKRYPLARLRRLLWTSLIGVTEADAACPVQYLRPLGFTPAGAALLAEVRGKTALALLAKPADLPDLTPQAQRQFDLECRAGDLYALGQPVPGPAGAQKQMTPLVMK
ncbi:MAG: nucleotidyltransferase family protein [Clostridia bacterium]|nr:nucleotidyltransferase family protein [Clostridia bacterium]